jgi:nucleoside-diphosphate-sugar epimerase
MTASRIAVTGANGAIGRKLIPMLCSQGYDVVAVGRDRPEKLDAPCEWRTFNLSDCAETIAAQLHDVEQLVHLAAIIPGKVPGEVGERALWDVNVLGTQRLIDAMALASVNRLVVASTANIYAPDQVEANETSAFGPRSRVLYLASKAAQEWLTASMCSNFDIGYAILRISSVIGDGRGIVDRLACELAAGRTVRMDDGAAFGADFIDCGDVCQGLLLAVESQLKGVYNLSSGKRTELIDVVFELAKNLKRPPDSIEMVHADRAPDTGFPAINCDRLRSYGFEPTPLSDVLKRIAKVAREQVTVT